jgi:uncharacterized membrane protein
MDASIKVTEVKAARGAAWLGEGFGLFRRAPMAWIALCAGWIAITFALLIIPLVGGVLANFLQPVFFASFAITALRQAAGEPIAAGDLFLGFKRNVRALVQLGAILLMAEIAIFAFMALLGLPVSTEGDKIFTVSEYVELLRGKEWIVMVGFALTVTVKGAFWFAPQLIALHDMTTAHAMRWSVYAALANFGTMVVYGVVLFVIFFLGILPWGLGLLVVIPMMVISTYIGYREVFEAKGEVAQA